MGGLAAPATVHALDGVRRFELFRKGDPIGFHTVAAEHDGGALSIEITIEIDVRILGFSAYRYRHDNAELWRGGRLESLRSRTDDDGETDAVIALRRGDGMVINGEPTAAQAPTSYWNYESFAQRPWFSSQSGKVLNLSFAKQRGGRRWSLSGDFATTLFYDAEREWRGCVFEARGAQVEYRQTAAGPLLMAMLDV